MKSLTGRWGSTAVRRTKRAVLASTVVGGAVIVSAITVPALAQPMQSGHVHPMATPASVNCEALVGPTPEHQSFTQKLPVPPRIDRRRGSSAVKLTMLSGSHRFSPDLPATPTFGYATNPSANDVYGGPTIEAMKGVPLKVSVRNALGEHPLEGSLDGDVMGTMLTDGTMPRGTVHLHGAHSEPKYDGLPDQPFGVGATNTYVYGNDQDATGLWYHDHSWGITRLQVASGLAGQLWLRDQYDTGDASNPLHLPTGSYEVPLTIQDRMFNADGTFAYPIGPHCGVQGLPSGYPGQWSPESFGDVAVVNGVIEPNMGVNRGIYRFRTLNASNARFYNLRLVRIDAQGTPTGQTLPLYQIGSDGGLLNAPVAMTELLIAPAERADVLVDFRSAPAGSKWRLVNDALAPYPDGGDGDLPQVMQFTVAKTTGPKLTIPTTLRGGAGRPAALPAVKGANDAAVPGSLKATSVRTVFLNEIADNITDPAQLEGEPVHVMMGNQFYADETTMKPRSTTIEAPMVNSVEEWDIVNTTGDAHPIHLHLTQFRLLNRQPIAVDPVTGETTYLTEGLNCGGANASATNCAAQLPEPGAAGTGPWPAPSVTPYLDGGAWTPAANEAGWKDTIVALPGTVTRIIVPFGGSAAGVSAPFVGDAKTAKVQRFTGTYVFHCHILEHEDNDMMSPLKVRTS